MKIPILSGIYADSVSDFRNSYPRNLIPVPKQTGISQGYLKPAHGLVHLSADGPGADRGGIRWNDVLYRVMGTKLVSVDAAGVITILGDVGGPIKQVTMDYGFDRLAIASSNRLWYWDGFTLTEVVDPDIGSVLDVAWVDGYFMTTDGTNLVVTELNDPTAVNPLRYGSSEADPDPIKGILKVRNEIYALNRHTIELFDNVGGTGFPFARIEGAQIQKGVLGTNCACVYMDAIAILGSGRNEPPGVYLCANASAVPISTREIDTILRGYTEAQLSTAIMESRTDKSHAHLMIHLQDHTLVYDGRASQVVQEPVWFTLTSTIVGRGRYRARNHVWCYDKWIFSDPFTTRLGTQSETVSTHYGEEIGWDFGTVIVYNDGNGAVFHELELVALTGNAALGDDATIWTSYSTDGVTFGNEHPRRCGRIGERNMRINWLQQGHMRHWRIQKFRGTSKCHMSMAALNARIEPLYV